MLNAKEMSSQGFLSRFKFVHYNLAGLPTPDTLQPAPHSLHPTPDTRHSTPDTRHPTPNTRILQPASQQEDLAPPPKTQGVLVCGDAGLVMNKLSAGELRDRLPQLKGENLD